jgi:hypothetical protein
MIPVLFIETGVPSGVLRLKVCTELHDAMVITVDCQLAVLMQHFITFITTVRV